MKIDGNILLEAGWEHGPLIGKALKQASELERTHPNADTDTILNLITVARKQFKYTMQEELPLREAIDPEDDSESLANIEAVREQMRHLSRCPVVDDIAIMPDACPAGSEPANITVGGCISVHDAIIPSAHSADVCCSLLASFFKSDLNSKEILDSMQASTHFGVCERGRNFKPEAEIHQVLKINPYLKDHVALSRQTFGSQGDGNHFFYLGKVELTEEHLNKFYEYTSSIHTPGEYYVMVSHHGSRTLGARLYKQGVSLAESFAKKLSKDIPKAAQWIPYHTQEGQDYFQALQILRHWTAWNHASIHNLAFGSLGIPPVTNTLQVFTPHNFVWKRGEHFLHGKGATPMWYGEGLHDNFALVPMNMNGSILILERGTGNPNYLEFAPHGAGRNMSRTKFENSLSDSEKEKILTNLTKDIDVRWFSGKPDISETPLAYKKEEEIISQIEAYSLGKIACKISPLGCIMAGEQERPWK